jgi:hypothetical protein
MDNAEFESLLFVDVADRAAGEAVPPHDKPKYYGRPWLQLRDEMVASGAPTVAELPAHRINAFYRSTQSGHGNTTRIFRRLFGAAANGATPGGRSR